MDVTKFIETLNEILQNADVETAVVPGQDPQIGDTLKALLPVTEKNDKVLLEIMVAPFSDELFIVQLFTTILVEIGPGYENLKDAILDWNLVCPLGAFGMSRELHQLYHKYVVPFPTDTDALDLAAHVAVLLDLTAAVISERIYDIVNISDGN